MDITWLGRSRLLEIATEDYFHRYGYDNYQLGMIELGA